MDVSPFTHDELNPPSDPPPFADDTAHQLLYTTETKPQYLIGLGYRHLGNKQLRLNRQDETADILRSMNITHESETIITRAIESMDEIVQDCIDRGEGPRLARAIDRYNDAAGQIERTHRVSIEDFNRCIPKVGQLQKMVERIERLV